MKSLFKFISLIMGIMFLFSSCDKLETEFGNKLIYFSNSNPRLELLDTENTIENFANLPDSVVLLTDVYRSGISDDMSAVTVELAIDQKTLEDMLETIPTVPEESLTEEMKTYRNSKVLPADYFSIPTSVTIPKGERNVTVPITLKMGKIKEFDNDYFNYSLSDFISSSIVKDKMMLIGFVIKGTDKYELSEDNTFCTVGITKCLTNIE